MKTLRLMALIGLLASAGIASAQSADCNRRYVTDSQGGFCGSCAVGYPPSVTVSIFAQRLRYYLICQSCGVPCQTRPNFVEAASFCQASTPFGNHLDGAMLFGVDRPMQARGFDRLIEEAPEIALVIASYGLDEGKAPQLDMRLQQSLLGRLPTADLARTLLRGIEPTSREIEANSVKLVSSNSVRVEARSEVHANGAAFMTITSSEIDHSTGRTVRPLNEYLVTLGEVPGLKVGVLQYQNYNASVYRIRDIQKVF